MENRVIQERDRFNTNYVISGDVVYVGEQVAKIMREYNPAGYGTHAREPVAVDGGVVVIITRSNSCD